MDENGKLLLPFRIPPEIASAKAYLHDLSTAIQQTAGDKELLPLHFALLQVRGDRFISLQYLSDALADYEAAARIEPTGEIQVKRDSVYTALNMLRTSFGDLSEKISVDPNNIDHYFERARNYVFLRDLNSARSDLDRMIELAPHEKKAYEFRFILNVLEERLDEALLDLDTLQRLNDKDALVYYYRAVVHLRQNNTVMASRALEKAAQLDTRYENFYFRYHRAFYDLDYPHDKAITVLSTMLEKYPHHDKILRFRSIRNALANKPVEALADADSMIALRPNDDAIALDRISILIYLVQKDREWANQAHAFELLFTSLSTLMEKVAPEKKLDLLFMRGSMYWHAENYAQAAEDFETVIVTRPEAPMTHLRCEAIYRKLSEGSANPDDKNSYINKAEEHAQKAKKYGAKDDGKLFELEVKFRTST
jgi:tetratricopeptide (TPR) repeat protein